MKIKTLLLGALTLATASAATAQEAYKPGITQEGLVYYLPKTALKITAKVERTRYTPGEFSSYAELYLAQSNVSQQASEAYRLIDISVDAIGVQDTTKCYSVKFNNKQTTTNATLTADGILLGINSDGKNITLDNIVKTGLVKPWTDNHKTVNPHDFMSQDILAAGSTGKMAQLTAEEIYEIRDSRNQLNRGQADFMPNDGSQLQLMLRNLAEQEAALTQTFLGTTVCDTATYVTLYCPKGEVENDVLMRFSKHNGLVAADDLSGAPYYISVADMHTVPTEQHVERARRRSENGLIVNIPSRARVTISASPEAGADNAYTKKPLTIETPMAQLGKTDILSSELLGKKFVTIIELSPVTGSVIKLETK